MQTQSAFSPLPIFLLSLFVFSFLPNSLSSTPRSFLDRGSSLSVDDESDILISPNKTFTCGFYEVGTNAYAFAIWFSKSANKTVVWMANRDRPVNGQGSRISLRRNGLLALTDVDGTVVWNTNTSSTNANKAELRNNGNLVLKGPKGDILWQSFDFPTDTLLPFQPLTKAKKLLSAKGEGVFTVGFFVLYFDNDNVLRLMYDGPEISSLYWPNPDNGVFGNDRTTYNSSRYAVFDEMGRFVSSDKLQFNASDMGFGIRRRLTLDYDGNLRLYSLNESDGSWNISWVALGQQCLVHGLCGRNGICIYTPEPKCSCPPGFVMKDTSDWNQGCRRDVNVTCNSHQVTFKRLPQVDFYGFDLNYGTNISFEACRQICLEECSCEAFGYRLTGTGVCYPKSALFNGYRSPGFPGSVYLKLPRNVTFSRSSLVDASEPICESKKSESLLGSSDMYKDSRDGGVKYVYLYWFASALGAIEVFLIASGWWYLFRKPPMRASEEDGYRVITNQFRRFTYAELKKATKNFKEELGRGGSGVVYKGALDDERVVAVKRLGDVIQGGEEFSAELSTIGKIYHMNLVRMWGYCLERARQLLVYEYVENGSLDKHLFSNGSSSLDSASVLGWKERVKIAVGTAKGLAYLHHECLEWVIHCDVKPENILLDSDFEPKIADFGLAKLSKRGGSGSNFSHIRGTKGYMAPEWALNLPITAKVDVYSYGVVLLEIVRGIRLSNWAVDGEEGEVELKRLVRVAKEKMKSEKVSWVGDLVDPRLNGQFNWNQAVAMVEIGISCVDEERSRRPTMDMIVQTLLYCEDVPSPVLS